MLTRRHFVQAGMAAGALLGPGAGRLAAQQRITQNDLLRFPAGGQVTLLHFATDIHAQLVPIHFREPSWNLGVGDARGQVPHLTGTDFLRHYGIATGTPESYALTAEDFAALACSYGKLGLINPPRT